MLDNKSSLVLFVRDRVIELIFNKELKPGDKLPNEFQLAEELAVSRGTIREAIKILTAENIVEIRRGQGTYVNHTPGVSNDPLGFKFKSDKYKLMLDCMELRLVLEPEIARISASKASKEDIDSIIHWKNTVEQQIILNEDHSQSDVEFHTAIAISTKNYVISNVIPIITTAIPLFISITNFELTESAIYYHNEIVNGIINQDGNHASEMMRRHIQENADYINSIDKDLFTPYEK